VRILTPGLYTCQSGNLFLLIKNRNMDHDLLRSETTVFNNSHWILLNGTIILLSKQSNGWNSNRVAFYSTESKSQKQHTINSLSSIFRSCSHMFSLLSPLSFSLFLSLHLPLILTVFIVAFALLTSLSPFLSHQISLNNM